MKKLSILFLCFFYFSTVYSQINQQFYFGGNIQCNKDIKEPGQLSGHLYGEWHFSHDQLVGYFRYLSEKSDKIKLIEYGRTHENRPLYLAVISSEDNIVRINEIKEKHINWIYSKDKNLVQDEIHAVVWLGYNVHGDESSAGNSAMLTAYYLIACEDEKVQGILRNSVIIIDPCLNPDGFNRSASYVNMHQSKNWIENQNSIQFAEEWPGSRSNHYWFDLNRDWLPVQQPESKARLKQFHQWKPSVLTDHHEMGVNGTFFFQPGVPSRVNPNTPVENYNLTKDLGYYHAKALDEIGSLYFSEESFDDFYYGKGSSYPDVNGSIGILFEQARVSGQIVDNIHGTTTFADAVRNQFKVSMSTIEGSIVNKEKLQDYQKKFYSDAFQLAIKNPVKAYAFACKEDPVRMFYFLDLLNSHEINIYRNKELITIQNDRYQPDEAYIVPLNQYQYRLIKSLFETQKTYTDSLFYDISTWNMPMSFNIEVAALNTVDKYLGDKIEEIEFPVGKFYGEASDVGYVFGWENFNSPKVLNKLLQKGIKAKVATKPFKVKNAERIFDFGYGSILIPANQPEVSKEELLSVLRDVMKNNGVDFYSLENGFRYSGIHFGSSNFIPLNTPEILMLTGDGFDSREAGEMWHLLDFRMDIPIARVNKSQLSKLNINNYNTLLIPKGSIDFSKNESEKISMWLKNGGKIIALGSSAKDLSKYEWIKLKVRKSEPSDSLKRFNYISAPERERSNTINGVILEAQVDITHPIAYGYTKTYVPVIKNSEFVIEKNNSPYSCPVYLSENSLLSGYIKQNQKKYIENSAYILNFNYEKGKIIIFSEDPNFRAYWYGTNKFFLNSIFFGDLIKDYK